MWNWFPAGYQRGQQLRRLAMEVSRQWRLGHQSRNISLHPGKFGQLDIDRFADPNNTKLPRFDARLHCPGAETVNTFMANWSKDFNWWRPPIILIADTLKNAKKCGASGVLLFLEWPSVYFWPLLTPNGKDIHACVAQLLVLDPYFFMQKHGTHVQITTLNGVRSRKGYRALGRSI